MIDLSKDTNFRSNLCDLDLRDNQGMAYKFKQVAAAQGFPGFVAESKKGKNQELEGPQPRWVRLTDELVFLPPDLVSEFVANATEDHAKKLVVT